MNSSLNYARSLSHSFFSPTGCALVWLVCGRVYLSCSWMDNDFALEALSRELNTVLPIFTFRSLMHYSRYERNKNV